MDNLEATHSSKNFFIRNFFRIKTSVAVSLANLKKEDLILDFGCGAGWLKQKLKNSGFWVIGYDITPEQTDIINYKKVTPTKIFAMDVFEHIPKEQIKKIINDFKKMNPQFELITIIPTENFISRKARRMLGKSERVTDHITPLKEILKILNSEMILVKKINFLGISWIGIFKNI